jgi:hypothetical protein
MLRKVIKLAIPLLIAHALYRSVPVFVHYYQFRDAVKETALFSKDRPNAEVAQRVMDLAAKHDIPIDPETIQVRREREYTYIDANYVQEIEWLPTYKRPWSFTVEVEGWSVRAPTAGEIIR